MEAPNPAQEYGEIGASELGMAFKEEGLAGAWAKIYLLSTLKRRFFLKK